MEDIWTAVRVLIVLLAGGGLLWLSWKYVPWPEPVAVIAKCIVAVILLILTVWLMITWGFKLAIPT